MTVYLQDSFNRADALVIGTPDVGGPYTLVGTSVFRITANQLGTQTFGASPGTIATAPCAADVDVTYTHGGATSGNSGVVFRFVDASNFYWVSAGNIGIQLNLRLAGVSSTFGNGQGAIAVGDIVRFVVKGAMFYVWRNGIESWSQKISAFPAATLAGPIIQNNNLVRIDDLMIQSPPTDPTAGFDGSSAFAYLGRDTKTLDTGAA